MASKHDFQKDWSNAKKQLLKFSQEAAVLAKKGEKELVKFSRRSKLHIDSTTASLKKEKLFYQIGKEYVGAKCPAKPNERLVKLLKDLDKVSREIERTKSKLSSGSSRAKKNATKKAAKKK